MSSIVLAGVDEQILRCFPVMKLLRPNLTEKLFLSQCKRQQANTGYQLAYMEIGAQQVNSSANENYRNASVVAVAGFRLSECFAWGKYLYVDDLVTVDSVRSKGYGGELFDWLVNLAKDNQCDELHLDSGVQRFAAHRFYLMKKMSISSHHFVLPLSNDKS